jgi:hypothetical protein
MTTRDYGSWNVGSTTRIADYIAIALGEHTSDYELGHIETEFTGKIQAKLPDGMVLCGNQLYGYRQNIEIDLTQIVESIDLYKIAEKYTLLGAWNANQLTQTDSLRTYVMECLGSWVAEYEVECVEQDLEDSINALMPRGHYLVDNKIYGPAGETAPNLEAILDQLDFWAFANAHCTTITER